MALQLNSTTSDSLDQTPSPSSNAETEQTRRILHFETASTATSGQGSNPPKIAAARVPLPPRPTDAHAEIAEVKSFMIDLNGQVNQLAQQMAALMSMLAQQNQPATAPPQPHPARAPAVVPATSTQTTPDPVNPDPASPDPENPENPDPASPDPANPDPAAVANLRAIRPPTQRAPVGRPTSVRQVDEPHRLATRLRHPRPDDRTVLDDRLRGLAGPDSESVVV